MKALTSGLIIVLFALTQVKAQATKGSVYGVKPTPTQVIEATKLADFMGTKTRITTDIKGRVIKVTRQKGGWFEIDAGNGRVIAAHFNVYNVNLPLDLKGKYVIAEGIAQRQFMADDLQHLAGDTVTGAKQHVSKGSPKYKIAFEVKGLIVE
jgi:hypothetical protein